MISNQHHKTMYRLRATIFNAVTLTFDNMERTPTSLDTKTTHWTVSTIEFRAVWFANNSLEKRARFGIVQKIREIKV